MSRFNNQHSGFNTQIVPVLLLEKDDMREIDMFRLMQAIDMVEQKDSYNDVVIEYRFPRETVHFYLTWMAQIWTGCVYNKLDEVRIHMDDYHHDNRERLRRAAMSGVI